MLVVVVVVARSDSYIFMLSEVVGVVIAVVDRSLMMLLLVCCSWSRNGFNFYTLFSQPYSPIHGRAVHKQLKFESLQVAISY